MASYTFTASQLEAFKRQWPCHGLPDKLTQLRFEFARNGDLVDYVAADARGKAFSLYDEDGYGPDGSAMVALSDDARSLAKGGRVEWMVAA